jgi:hypothetical protein
MLAFRIIDIQTHETVATRPTVRAARRYAERLNLTYGARRYVAVLF